MRIEVKNQKRLRRKTRVRSKVVGTAKRPRLSVFRSNKYVHLQLIDDSAQKTLVAVKKGQTDKKTGVEQAKEAAKKLAEEAKKAGITEVVFDRAGYKYHGRVKAVAETAREAGLKF